MAGDTPHSAVANIETVVRIEEAAMRERPFADRLSDAIANFVGTVSFVALHLLWFAVWAVWNTGLIPSLHAFDPYPFALLCMIVSLEGVLLSTFVLIKQNRMSLRSDRRSHLDLQVNLLTEQEVTKIIQLLHRISGHLGIEAQVTDPEAQEFAEVTAVENLAHDVQEKLPDAV